MSLPFPVIPSFPKPPGLAHGPRSGRPDQASGSVAEGKRTCEPKPSARPMGLDKMSALPIGPSKCRQISSAFLRICCFPSTTHSIWTTGRKTKPPQCTKAQNGSPIVSIVSGSWPLDVANLGKHWCHAHHSGREAPIRFGTRDLREVNGSKAVHLFQPLLHLLEVG